MNVIEKDNIQELFSKAFENHTSTVKPELWTGVQAKMAAAGMTGAVAAKGISAFTKWIIGTAAVSTVGITSYIVLNSSETDTPKTTAPVKELSVNTTNDRVNDDQTTTVATQPLTVDAKTENRQPTLLEEKNPKENSFEGTLNSVIGEVLVGTPERLTPERVAEISAPAKTNENKGTAPQPVTEIHETGAPVKETPNAVSESPIKEPNTAASTAGQVRLEKEDFPNIFTPNGDTKNDYFEPLKRLENIREFEMTVADGNGKVVFKSNDPDFKWNGTYFNNGEQSPVGIYTWTIIYTDEAGSTQGVGHFVYLGR